MEFIQKRFLNIEQALEQAKLMRCSIDPKRVPKYYFPYLDDVLFGIAPAELVLIGADTGQGKSWMANHLAFSNAFVGKKVYLFSLEGHKAEVINRHKWKIILREYFKNPTGKEMLFSKYEMNMIEGIETLDKIAEEEMKEFVGKNLMLFDKSSTLDIDLLVQQIGIAEDAELIIIDHLHYFDMADDSTEAKNLSQIMKKVKFITEERNIPVVMISHLRKKSGLRGLPDNEDFMGTSNIPKIASTCILLSSNPTNHKISEGKYSTIVRVSKSRAGASTTIAAELFFNSRTQDYDRAFTLGKVIAGEYKPIETQELPYWAKSKEQQKGWWEDE